MRPKRKYCLPVGTGLRRKTLWRVWKALARRYYQLLSGHAAIESFLHERMTGALRLESSECRWCGNGKRESRPHLLMECQAWAPQIRRLWKWVGKDRGWKHPRAPAVIKLWKEEATGAVLEFLVEASAGRWLSVARMPRVEEAGEGKVSEGE